MANLMLATSPRALSTHRGSRNDNGLAPPARRTLLALAHRAPCAPSTRVRPTPRISSECGGARRGAHDELGHDRAAVVGCGGVEVSEEERHAAAAELGEVLTHGGERRPEVRSLGDVDRKSVG